MKQTLFFTSKFLLSYRLHYLNPSQYLKVGSVIKSPEISGLVPTLLKGLCHPKEHTKYSLNILLQVRNGLYQVPQLDLHGNMLEGSDEHLERKILDPERLSRVESIFGNLSETIKIYGPWSSVWVGEAGGAYNSGGNHVSNRFLNSFWYLDQLGIASCYNTKVYCRQTLIGGNYGLLNATTFAPNPDYYRRNALKRDPLVRRPDLAIFIVIFELVRGKVALFVFSMSIVAEGDKVEGEVLEGAA
ncbi:hypothetical protein JHK85_009975 [Glycine max]|nr:hypothetical protein JHK85_009975 [Glycine max]